MGKFKIVVTNLYTNTADASWEEDPANAFSSFEDAATRAEQAASEWAVKCEEGGWVEKVEAGNYQTGPNSVEAEWEFAVVEVTG